jgi:hypothetical protein
MISPDITISNLRLRWGVGGMRFTAPLLEMKLLFESQVKNQKATGVNDEKRSL